MPPTMQGCREARIPLHSLVLPGKGKPTKGGLIMWELLLDDGTFEWWAQDAPDAPGGAIVWRRRVSTYNFIQPDGTPSAIRREGSLSWWRRMMGLEVGAS